MADVKGHASWSVRAFRALVALYPAEFRDEYGREVAIVFADRYRDATTAAERTRVWIEAVLGLLREAPKEHVQVLSQDLRYALRMMRLNPGFSLTVILTLALGVGANTAVFQLINAVRLRPLPVPRPDELVEVRIANNEQGFGIRPGPYGQLTRPIWQELRSSQQALSGIFAWRVRDVRVGELSELRRANGIDVSGDFFRVLGVPPWRGRLLEPADEGAPCPATRAVVSHAYWQQTLGGQDMSSASRLRVNGELVEIIGVMPPWFSGLAVGERLDIVTPFCGSPSSARREVFDTVVMGRLRSGWTLQQASAHFDSLSAGIFEATTPGGYSAASTTRFRAFRLAADSAAVGVSHLRQEYDTPLKLLLVITGLVLLIACANLANLLLARAIARAREVSVRLALGASRVRLVRQFLAESALVAVVGAIVGLGVAQILSRVLIRAISTDFGGPALVLTNDWRVLLFTGIMAMATCIVFGIAPAFRATRVQVAAALQSGGRAASPSRPRAVMQRVMVVTQIAVSLVLLVGALLFVRSFRNLLTVDTGMRQTGIVAGFFGFNRLGLTPDRYNEFQRQLTADVKSVSGILDAATTSNTPLIGGSWTHGTRVGDHQEPAKFTWVGPGYFSTMGIPILEGRGLTLRDTSHSPRVALVNQTFARKFANGRTLIGQTLQTNGEPNYPSTVYEIVGVIADTKYNSLRGAIPPMVFAPDSQHPALGPNAAMMIHSSLDSASAMAAVRKRLRDTHPGLVMEFADFQAGIRDTLVRDRVMAALAGFFGVVAAMVAMVGLYGMISFAVGQRRQEIGIRAALGAQRTQVIGIVMREAAWLVAIGIAIGTLLALAAGRGTKSLLFEVAPNDPATMAIACALLAAIAAIASFIPARRVARLDLLTALRHE